MGTRNGLTRAALLAAVREHKYLQPVAKALGYSDVSVRKHLKKFGFPRLPRSRAEHPAAKQITRTMLNDAYKEHGSTKLVAKALGCCASTIRNYRIKFSRAAPPKTKRFRRGQRFNDLVVVEDLSLKGGKALCTCICDCGSVYTTYKRLLASGATKSCGCRSKRAWDDHPLFTGYKEISGRYWNVLRNGALTRGLDFRLSMQYAWSLFVRQRGLCALTGVPISLGKKREQTASLDRIDPTKPYIRGNVQWVHKALNRAKGALQNDMFIYLCQLVATYNPGETTIATLGGIDRIKLKGRLSAKTPSP